MRALFESLPLKLVSLGLAALLWFLIAGEKTSEIGVAAPVELQNFPRELELTGEAVNQVEVRLRGSPGMIQRIVPGDVSAQVDLAGVGEGEHIVHLTEESIRMPFGVQMVKVSPAELILNLERTVQKVLPVRPRLAGEPSAGYAVAAVTSDPAEVRVAGPRTRVEAARSAHTEPVAVAGATGGVQRQVTVGLEDPLLRIVGDSRVRVVVRVEPRAETRAFERPVAVRGGRGRAHPETVRVVLAGPAALLAAVEEDEVEAWVDASSGGGEAVVRVELRSAREGVTVREAQPPTVRLTNVR